MNSANPLIDTYLESGIYNCNSANPSLETCRNHSLLVLLTRICQAMPVSFAPSAPRSIEAAASCASLVKTSRMLRLSTWKLGICLNPRFVFSEGLFSVYSFLVGTVFISFEGCFGEHFYCLLAAIHVIRWLSAWLVVLWWRWLLLLFGSSGATTTMFV